MLYIMILYLVFFIIMVALSILYDKYRKKQDNAKNIEEYDLVKKYLLNEQSLLGDKPNLWIPIEYEINSRNWLNFGSRNTRRLNQPYLYLTVKTIIDKCGDDFNVCLIDDSSIAKVLPNWNIDLDALADPIKSHVRSLAHLKVLHKYGGVIVPPSLVCLSSLVGIHERTLSRNDCYVGEFVNRNSSNSLVNTFPSHKLIGCEKGSETIGSLIQNLEILESRDATNEMDFLGQIDRLCYQYIQNQRMGMVDGSLIGTKDASDENVIIDQLLQKSYINFSNSAVAIYIPADEVLLRTKYEWFARLSNQQLLESDTIIAKYILLASKN